MLANLVLWTSRKNLLLAPVRNVPERLAVDKVEEGLLLGPFAGDQVGCIVAHVFPERGRRMSRCGFEGADHRLKLLLEFLLLACQNVIVHSDRYHL
jgi:hypothetical protein